MKKYSKMTKDDLKEGMVVELKNEDLQLLWHGKFYDSYGNPHRDTSLYYAWDLKSRDYPDEDIMRVYSPHDILQPYDFFDRDHLTLIWEREKPKARELTVEEISKKLGYEVKIVK